MVFGPPHDDVDHTLERRRDMDSRRLTGKKTRFGGEKMRPRRQNRVRLAHRAITLRRGRLRGRQKPASGFRGQARVSHTREEECITTTAMPSLGERDSQPPTCEPA